MFSLVGYRPPTIQRIRLGAGRDGQLTAIAHDVVEHTATIHEYTEPTALPTHMMYAAPHRYRRRCKEEVPNSYSVPVALDTPGYRADSNRLNARVIRHANIRMLGT